MHENKLYTNPHLNRLVGQLLHTYRNQVLVQTSQKYVLKYQHVPTAITNPIFLVLWLRLQFPSLGIDANLKKQTADYKKCSVIAEFKPTSVRVDPAHHACLFAQATLSSIPSAEPKQFSLCGSLAPTPTEA